MKEMKHWISAAILCCGIGMTSCVDEQLDNPSTPEPEQASAVDPGKWWLDESYMDKSVKPGDNFYMYCLGTWWKNTTLPAGKDNASRFDVSGQPTFGQKAMKLTDANYDKYLSHLKWAEDGSDAAKAAKKAYDDKLTLSGMDKAKTNEEILKAFGKMGALGVSTCLRLEPFSLHGKICLYVDYTGYELFMEKTGGSDDIADLPSLQERIRKNPEILAHLVPLDGKSSTRAIPDEYKIIKLILEGMGFNNEDVYILEDYAKLMDETDRFKQEIKMFKDEFSMLKSDMQLCDDPADFKKMLLKYHRGDYGLISKATMEEFNKENAENSKLPTRAASDKSEYDEVLSLDAVANTMTRNYLPYLRSKLVADQMVPKGLKQEYTKYCYEMKAVFAQRIKDNAWLSEGSKKNALEKLDAMIFNVCYPEKWITEGLPDFSKSQSLVEDIYILRKARIDLLKAIVGKKSAENDNSFTAMIMSNTAHLGIENAFYEPSFNSMNILPYYTLPPFYDATQSLVINYQNFDTLCHEMTHGFDDKGSKFDKNGDYKPEGIWASPADKAEFDRRADLLVKCYEGYDVLPDEMPGVKAVGKGTLGENIADLGGEEIAWQGFLNRLKADGYTGDQLKLMKQRYFLSIAEEFRSKYNKDWVNYAAFGKGREVGPDPHSMDKERVNGVVANMDGWYEAFDITGGALYRKPADRIKIW